MAIFVFWGYRDDGGDLELAGGYMAELEGRTEDGGEDRDQLVCAVLQGGGLSTLLSRQTGVCHPKEKPIKTITPSEGKTDQNYNAAALSTHLQSLQRLKKLTTTLYMIFYRTGNHTDVENSNINTSSPYCRDEPAPS